MRLSLIAPFRIPFSIPKSYLLAHNKEWIKTVQELQEAVWRDIDLGSLNASELEIGNYGWGKKRQTVYTGDDPGWFFRDSFMFRFGSSKIEDKSHKPAVFIANSRLRVQCSNSNWSCWMIGNTVAVLILEVDFPACGQFVRSVTEDSKAYDVFRTCWVEQFLQREGFARVGVDRLARWLGNSLPKHMGPTDSTFRADRSLLLGCRDDSASHSGHKAKHRSKKHNQFQHIYTETHPIYSLYYERLWTHSVYSFSREEISTLIAQDAEHFNMLLSEQHVNALKEGAAVHGWGHTSLISDEHTSTESSNQSLNALCVIQYFYSCFDIADTLLPVLMARARVKANRGRHHSVVALLRRTRTDLRTIACEYNDLRVRTASQAHDALEAYHMNWRVADLVRNLKEKLRLLDEMTASSSEEINRKTNATVELILFLIALLSVLGLAANIHQYLIGDYETRLMAPLHRFALAFDKGDVVLYSLVMVLAVFMICYLLRARSHR